MSRKIWRGPAWHDGVCNEVSEAHIAVDEALNCTVVPDSAYFPVREAMAFCRLMETAEQDEDGSYRLRSDADIDKGIALWGKYRKAVNHMRAKARRGK